MGFRKPTIKDKTKGVFAFIKILIIGLAQFNPSKVEFAYCTIKTTIRGEFEVADGGAKNDDK